MPGWASWPGVDDHALFTGRGRDYITVGRERTGREPCDKHKRPFSRYGVSGYRGDPHGREPVTKGACPGIWQVRFANDREHCGIPGASPEHARVSRSEACIGFAGLPPVNSSGSR